ncbi:hypothetical protein MMC14_006642 [Varicellaria rhodocarpa]|nr:hypothetical protein [Varicellaria rhodocarpa]
MSWLRRLSRDRGTSRGEQDFEKHNSMPNNFRPPTSYNDSNQNAFKDTQYSSAHPSQDMLQSYRRSAPADHPLSSPPRPPGTSSDATMYTAPSNLANAPDPLTRAFNEAIKPYIDQIDLLKSDLEDANLQIQHLESERADMHAWIDKRGLRPDLTPRLASTMSTSPIAASTFSNQLERKMTMLNFDLHRLADSLPSRLPTSTIAQTLSTLLPSISHLSTLSQGALLAFELLIKLGGNINSHNTGEENEADIKSTADFYTRLDESMVDVIRRRIEQGSAGEESPEWQIGKDVKRLEKTGVFLRSEMGLQNYFPRSLDVLSPSLKLFLNSSDQIRLPYPPQASPRLFSSDPTTITWLTKLLPGSSSATNDSPLSKVYRLLLQETLDLLALDWSGAYEVLDKLYKGSLQTFSEHQHDWYQAKSHGSRSTSDFCRLYGTSEGIARSPPPPGPDRSKP